MSEKQLALTVTISDGGFTISTSAEFEKRKTAILGDSSFFHEITTEDDKIEAGDLAQRLRNLERDVEKSREEVKKPVLKLGKDIDAKAKTFAEPILKERARIEALIETYLRKQLQEEREVQRKAEEEARKVEEERARIQRENEKREEAAFLSNNTAPIIPVEPMPQMPVVVVAEPEKIEGVNAKETIVFKVVNLAEFAKWALSMPRPDQFIKIEARKSDLEAYLNLPGVAERGIPGLKIETILQVKTRASRSSKPESF